MIGNGTPARVEVEAVVANMIGHHPKQAGRSLRPVQKIEAQAGINLNEYNRDSGYKAML
jgi:hypothetical protein